MTSAIDYPVGLPLPLLGTLDEATQEPWVDDPSSVGSARRRKRYTRALAGFTWSLRLTESEKDALLAFYDTTLDDGVLSFNWTHPTTGDSYEVEFSGRPQPKHLTKGAWAVDIGINEI